MSMRVASAPVSWGVMENIPLPEDYSSDRVLDEIAEAGYAGTELGPYGFLPTSANELRAVLAKRKLTLCSAFIEMDLGNAAKLEEGIATVLTSAKLISQAGAKLLVLSDADVMPWMHRQAWMRSGKTLAAWWHHAIRQYAR